MYNTLPGTSIMGGTWQFASKFPEIDIVARRTTNADLVNPNHATYLVDGEFVKLVPVAGEPRNPSFRALTVEDLYKVDRVIGANNDTLLPGSTFTDQVHTIHPVRMRKGRSDVQIFGSVPVVEDFDYTFKTRLINDGLTYAIGAQLIIQLIANADLPAGVQTITTKANVAGLVPPGQLIEAGAVAPEAANIEFVAVVLDSKDANGWITCRMRGGRFSPVGTLADN